MSIEPFNGATCRFRRWEESVLLLLRTLNLDYVLLEPRPDSGDEAEAAKKWDRDDALCRGHILRALSDRVFHLHVHRRTAKAVWDALHVIYDVEDEVARLVAGRRFSDYQMSDDRSVLEQLSELQYLAHQAFPEERDSAFIVDAIVDKLPPSSFKYITLCVTDMSMDELCSRIRKNEINQKFWKQIRDDEASSSTSISTSAAGEKLQRVTMRYGGGVCYTCGQQGHFARDCKWMKL